MDTIDGELREETLQIGDEGWIVEDPERKLEMSISIIIIIIYYSRDKIIL